MRTNDALRAALQMNVGIGGLRIGRELLTQQQINTYFLARIVDLEETHFKAIGALQQLGMECCDECEEWKPAAQVIQSFDRVQCTRCFSWEYFIQETDTDEAVTQTTQDLIRQLRQRGMTKMLPCDRDGKLQEPFLTEYLKQAQRL